MGERRGCREGRSSSVGNAERGKLMAVDVQEMPAKLVGGVEAFGTGDAAVDAVKVGQAFHHALLPLPGIGGCGTSLAPFGPTGEKAKQALMDG